MVCVFSDVPLRFCKEVGQQPIQPWVVVPLSVYFSIKFRIFSCPRGISSLWRTAIALARILYIG